MTSKIKTFFLGIFSDQIICENYILFFEKDYPDAGTAGISPVLFFSQSNTMFQKIEKHLRVFWIYEND